MTGKEETDMIKMQNVRKTYPGFDFELSLEIPEGRITGLIGKNGAGKSTAIRLMLGKSVYRWQSRASTDSLRSRR